MHMDSFVEEALMPFLETGEIAEIVDVVKSGKEATVLCCRGGETCAHGYVAAKVYRPLKNRSFRQNSIYQQGRVQFAHNSRIRRALNKNTEFGRKIAQFLWVNDEWETLCAVYEAGVAAPAPIAVGEHAVLMQFIGEGGAAAARLHEVDVSAEEAESIAEEIIEDVATMLHAHRVHGDLSPYNVLYDRGRVYVIDYPQSVDPRLHGGALNLLRRDVSNICAWAIERGAADFDGDEITNDLWRAFQLGEIG